MTVSTRSYLTAGTAAMVVGAMAITPVQPSAPASITADTVRLAAAVQPLVNDVNTAAATFGQATPATVTQQPHSQKSAQANNNVSDAINTAYGVIMYWADYLANQLGPYLLGWVPFGYLISDQIYMWFNYFTVPVADSFVYDFLDPVVNDFWNPVVWGTGLAAFANTTGAALRQTIGQEITYLITLQWLPFPIPPLPPLPLAALKTPAGAAKAADAAAAPTSTTRASGTGHSARPQIAAESPDTVDDTAPVADAVTTPIAAKSASRKASSAKSDSATSGTDSAGPKKSTGGSARPKGAKADKAAK